MLTGGANEHHSAEVLLLSSGVSWGVSAGCVDQKGGSKKYLCRVPVLVVVQIRTMSRPGANCGAN